MAPVQSTSMYKEGQKEKMSHKV